MKCRLPGINTFSYKQGDIGIYGTGTLVRKNTFSFKQGDIGIYKTGTSGVFVHTGISTWEGENYWYALTS